MASLAKIRATPGLAFERLSSASRRNTRTGS